MDLGLHTRDKGMSLEYTSKEETPHNLTPKYIEDLAKEVMGNNKIVEMFTTMEIVRLRWVIWVWKSSHLKPY